MCRAVRWATATPRLSHVAQDLKRNSSSSSARKSCELVGEVGVVAEPGVGVDELEGDLAGQARPAPGRGAATPASGRCGPSARSPMIVPSPRSSRSTSASSNPSVVAHQRLDAAPAPSVGRAGHQPAASTPPRRARPGRAAGGAGRCRSGRRRAPPSPWRSGRRRRPRSRSWPRARRARRRGTRSITASFSADGIRPCSSPRRSPASSPRDEPLVGLLGRRAPRASRTPRSAGTRRRPGGRRRPRSRTCGPRRRPPSSGPSAQTVRDRRAPGRHLVEHGHVEVAVDGHRRRARDRRGRHHQHVGHRAAARSWPAARPAARRRSGAARRSPRRRATRNSTPSWMQRVRADDDVDVAVGQPGQDLGAAPPPVDPVGEQRDPQRPVAEESCRRRARSRPSSSARTEAACCSASTSVGRHQRALVAALHRDEQRASPPPGLARADVALQQAVHRDGARPGRPRSRRSPAAARRSARRAAARGSGATSSPPTSWRDARASRSSGRLRRTSDQLDPQQLVEDQPPARLLLLRHRLGEVDAVQRRASRSTRPSRLRTAVGTGSASPRGRSAAAPAPPARRSPRW